MMRRSFEPGIFVGQFLCWLVALSAFSARGIADQPVAATSHTRVGDGALHAYVGTISLPADGIWQIRVPENRQDIRELYLTPTGQPGLRHLGNRMYAALQEREIQNGRWTVQWGFEGCREFAQEKNGIGPELIADFSQDTRWEHLADGWGAPSRRLDGLQEFVDASDQGSSVFLIPQVRFRFSPSQTQPDSPEQDSPEFDERKVVLEENRDVLAFELRPFVDDGMHWVLWTDGNCERVAIEPALLEKHQVKIRPMLTRPVDNTDAAPNLKYKLVLVASEAIGESLPLKAHNPILDNDLVITWNPSNSSEEPYTELRGVIRDARRFAWRPYQMAGNGGVLNVWDQEIAAESLDENPRRNLSLFSVLGGRAAIEETLQLQNLDVTDTGDEATIEVNSLPGVEVQSHPFEEMLDGQPGGHLAIASVVPADRFFVYVGKPESISALLDSGAPFVASLGTTLTGNGLQYNLEAKYLARLGMTRDWVDAVLKSGLTSEVALFAPDLFFIDGTGLTIVAKLEQPRLFQSLLSLLGVSKLSSNEVLELPTSTDAPAFLALRDDLLFASTSRSELELSLELFEQEGEGSLGTSDEFRYMLTKLPVNEETRIYAYLSDSFVRRLVGPRVKLGQRRRMLAKAKMETLTGRGLLARLDGHPEPDSLSSLVRSEHLSQDWQSEDLSINATGLVRSDRHGTLSRLRTLPETPLDQVTPEEANAYRLYVENYSNFWRRFFDPIAVRLDEVGTDQLELSTFILPLVDNSIYNGLRMVLADQSDEATLFVPIVEPTPVVQFSVNLNEQAWQQIAGNFSDFFTRYSGASPAMMDDFGPSVHVAVFDADPIIAMGSGDVLGAFGGDALRGGGSQMLMLPIALSVLTRPCSIMVETQSPERTLRYLRQAAMERTSSDRRASDFDVSFYQVDDRDEWIWAMDLFGVVKLRYGVEVVDKYLVIRNIPWSSDDKVVSVAPAELNAAMLQAKPSACHQQLPGLFAAASDANRRAVMGGLARLYPMMLSGSGSVEQAAAEHQRLFGFYPRPLENDSWRWKDLRLASDGYGEPTHQRQPAFQPGTPIGLMDRIDSIRLNMQFEEDGLRSSVRWRLR